MPMPVFDTEADVPEAFRPEYAAGADGKWKSKAEIELEVQREKHATLLDERRKEEQRRKDAEAAAAEAKRLLDAKNAGVPEAELQRLRDEDAAKRAAELTPLSTENAALKEENRKLKLDDRVQKIALDNGVLPDRIKLAMKELKEFADLGDEGGIVWKDASGKVSTQTDAQFFEWFEKEYALFFEFKGGSGGGTGGSSRGRTPPPAAPKSQVQAKKRQQVLGAL